MVLSHGLSGSLTIACRGCTTSGVREAGHLLDGSGPAGDGRENFPGFNETRLALPVDVDAHDGAVADFDAGDGGLLVDIDAFGICARGHIPMRRHHGERSPPADGRVRR